MTAARAHVVRIRVDATGTDDVVAAFIATKKTPYEVHDLIMEALKDYRPACGGYQQGEEVPFPSLLFFALDQTREALTQASASCLFRRSTSSA